MYVFRMQCAAIGAATLALAFFAGTIHAQTMPGGGGSGTYQMGPGMMQGYRGMGPGMMQGYRGMGPGMMQGYRGMGPGMMWSGQPSSGAAAANPSAAAAASGLDVNSKGMPVPERIVISVLAHALPGPDGKRHDAFMPANFVLKSGVPATLVIVNYDESAHTITAPALGLNIATAAAKPGPDERLMPTVTTYTFTPAHKGLIRWYCATPCDGRAGGWAMTPGFDGIGRDGYMAGYFAVV